MLNTSLKTTTSLNSSLPTTQFKHDISHDSRKITTPKLKEKEPIDDQKSITKRSINSNETLATTTGHTLESITEIIGEAKPTNPFYYEEIAYEIAQQLPVDPLFPNPFLNMRQVNKACKGPDLKRLRLILTPNDLHNPDSEKVKFALKTGIMIKIKTVEGSEQQENSDLELIANFIKNPDNSFLLNQIEAFEFGFVGSHNIQQMRELLRVLAKNNDNLSKLNLLIFGAIGGSGAKDNVIDLTISEIPSLTSITCNELYIYSTLKFSKLNNLSTVSCEGKGNLIFEGDFKNLASVSVGDRPNTLSLIFTGKCPNLISITCGKISNNEVIWRWSQCNNLRFFKCRGIEGAILRVPALLNLEVLDCLSLACGAKLLFEGELPSLRKISIKEGTYGSNVTIPGFPSLTTLNFGDIRGETTITFTDKFEKLTNLSYGRMNNPEILKKFQALEVEIKEKAAKLKMLQ